MINIETQLSFTLSVLGEDFDPWEISSLISTSPTTCWIKGDPIPINDALIRRDKLNNIRRETAWELSTGFVKSLSSEDASNIIEEKLFHHTASLKSFIETKGLHVVLNVVVEVVDSVVPSIHFNKKFLSMCDALGAEIDIDMYLLTNE